MNIITKFVKHMLETNYDTFDHSVIERTRERVIDTFGCVVGGVNGPGCSAMVDLAREWGGKEEASIGNLDLKVPVHTAAMINCVMARSYDFEPAGPVVDGKSTPAHLSGTTVPTAISVGEYVGASGKEFLTALILGDDFASRIIAASNLNLDSGFESTGTVNAFGVAAITGKLLKLNEEQMLNTFGIVINQFGGTFQNIFDGVHTFKLPQGLAAQAGVFAAKLASKGFTGIKDPLFSKYGYFALYCKSYDRDILVKNLGEEFCSDNTCKPYPCCRSNHSAIDCILNMQKNQDIPVEEIAEVIVSLPQKAKDFAVGQPFIIRDVPQIDAAFSAQYAVANVLIRKCVTLEHYTVDFIKDQRIYDLVARIRVVAGIPKEQPLGAEVKVVMNNGTEYIERVDIPLGNGTLTPMTLKNKKEKYFQNIRFAGTPKENGKKVLNLIEEIEHVDNVAKLMTYLRS